MSSSFKLTIAHDLQLNGLYDINLNVQALDLSASRIALG